MNPNRSTPFRLDSWRRGRVAVLVVALVALAVVLGGLPAGAAQPAPLPVAPLVSPPTDQIIVGFGNAAGPASLSPADTTLLADRLSAAAGVSLSFVRPMSGDAYVFRLPEPVELAEAADISARLAALPDVEYAEPDAIMQIVHSPRLSAGPANTELTPDDTRFVDQWHYRYEPGEEEGLNLLPAWNITTGAANTVVAVVDTGIRSHADLAGRTLAGYDFIADVNVANDGNGRDADPADPGDWTASNFCFLGSEASDSSWHGTHVAGTIGAASNNGSDVAGVNWLAKVVPVRVLGRCGGYLSDIVAGTRWAGGLAVPGVPANANPADVINLSLGGPGSCAVSYQSAFNELAAAGVVVVVAAGNSNLNASGFQPANCNQVITVAANDKDGDRAYYSNYGAVVDITAPGGAQAFPNDSNGVLSTLNAGLAGPGADSLVYYQGTSMAAPHVAGLASLLVGERPNLTPAEVLDILQTTARDFPNGSNCTPAQCGPGIADAFTALSALDVELVAPELVAPADGATLATDAPLLEWSAVAGADAYQVQVSENAAFSAVIVNEPSVAGTTTPVTLPGEGDYWWRVRAKAGAENGPWSEIWQFTVAVDACLPPGVPILSSPADGSETNKVKPTFTWAAAANATEYEIIIGENPGLPEAIMVGHPTAPSYTFPDPLEVNTTYYWAVRAHNKAGDCDLTSAWSATRTVSIVDEVVPETHTAFLPLIIDVPYVPPAAPLVNGDFEQGAVAWSEYSSRGFPIITHLDDEEDMLTHGGVWAAWLGGLDNESAELTQEVTVPADQPYLAYYYLLNSGDGCGFDSAGVMIDGAVVRSYELCDDTSMTGFERAVIDLSDYAGQTVTLGFSIATDESLVSSFFVDDVSFVSSAAAAEAPADGAPTSALPIRHK
jgi:serine protease